ncbi:MAG TPA: DinB family protein [Gemmatimonadales bacterium]|nr:DinB family protein [Gemmatimonadales bacterium]
MTPQELLPLEGNRAMLRQGVALLEQLSDAQYAGQPAGRPSVGAQIRHVLEHYLAFLRGFSTGYVDYDARAREERLERSREAALSVTRECLAGLAALAGEPDRPLQVQLETESGGPPDWRSSSAGRELQFLCGHTVHHWALIRLLLAEQGCELTAELGVAPSTLTHRNRGKR